jgi:hypothetical protein
MVVKIATGAAGLRGDEEASLWATASLREARQGGERTSAALLEAVVEEQAFGLGARGFPPAGARATRGRLGTVPGHHAPTSAAPHPSQQGRTSRLRRYTATLPDTSRL